MTVRCRSALLLDIPVVGIFAKNFPLLLQFAMAISLAGAAIDDLGALLAFALR